MNSIIKSSLALLFAAGLSFVIGCSSSTDTGTQPKGVLTMPATIDFGNIPSGQTHDTTIRISNTGNDSLVITSSTSSSTTVSDLNFGTSVTIAKGGYQDIHISVTPKDTGAFLAADTLHYKTAGSTTTSFVTLKAHVFRGAPGAGSTFTFDVFTIDTNGVPGPHSDSVFTIISNSMSYQGKTNVVAVLKPTGDTSFFHQEDNGDLSSYIDFSTSGSPLTLPSGWFIIPVASQSELKSTLLQQSNVTIPGIPVPVNILVSSDAKGNGNEVVSVGSESFATEKAFLTITVNVSALGGLVQANQIETTNVWFAPGLKFYVKRQDVSQAIGSSKQSSVNYSLKSYIIK